MKPDAANVKKRTPAYGAFNSGEAGAVLGAADCSAAACVKYGCWRTPLKYMNAGESHQTTNGFFVIKIGGWYCPRCGGSYGGRQNGRDQ